MRRIVALLLIAAAAVVAAPRDPADSLCVLPVGFSASSAAVACIQSVPYDPTIAAATVDSLRKSVAIFAFAQPASNPPVPYSDGLAIEPVDLIAVTSNSHACAAAPVRGRF
jgi:hypothetical protein